MIDFSKYDNTAVDYIIVNTEDKNLTAVTGTIASETE